MGLNSDRKKYKNAENTAEEKEHRYTLVVVTSRCIGSLVQRTFALPFYGHTFGNVILKASSKVLR